MSPPPGKPTNGILPMPTTVLQNKSTPAPRGPAPKKPTPPRLKVVLRRLPPGLTEAEFWNVVGEEWRVGAGKVDWFAFKEGKISTE
jgi:regulator of nonsense transcripts 3